jgi:hypothetical protein
VRKYLYSGLSLALLEENPLLITRLPVTGERNDVFIGVERDHNFDHNWRIHLFPVGDRWRIRVRENSSLSVNICIWKRWVGAFRKQQAEGSNPTAGSSKV